MYEQINKQLAQNQQDVLRLRKIEAMLGSLEEERRGLLDKFELAKASLEKENKGYEKITNRSISSIFLSVIGRLEERAEKGRQEALRAELKYNQVVKGLEDVKNKISGLEAEKLRYMNSQSVYDRLYNEKLQLLLGDRHNAAKEIMALNSQLEQSKNNLREIEEAINVGGEVKTTLTGAIKSLDDAEGWGIWDMLGGGFISDVMKHSHIDDAGKAAERVQSLLMGFRAELADIQISEEVKMDINSFAKFADFFFDGLIADWYMQGKINETQEGFKKTLHDVEAVMGKLIRLKGAEKEKLESIGSQINKLVIGS
ncbi:MAG: hypothetical protein LBV08_09365 [Clostridiales bacterium]|nr:hypothetical protein [Clostridiales bacterium]